MQEIQEIIAKYYRNEITEDEARQALMNLEAETMADFILQAFDRQWITLFNLGINDDGNLM